MSLYTRLTKRDLPAEESTLAIASVFAELTRYQRGTRTELQVRDSLGLSSDEWADALVLVGKIDGVYDANRLADDLQRVIALLEYNRDLTGQGYGINSWEELLAEVDAWIATGDYGQ